MRRIRYFLLMLTFPVSLIGQQNTGYRIDISIRGLADSAIYLAYHFGDKQYLKDTVKLDKSGKGVFTGQEALPQGIYMVVLPQKQYFEILVSDDQVFSADCSYNNYSGTLNFTGSVENTS